MTVQIPFDNSFARLPGDFYTRQNPTEVTSPTLLAWNGDLAELLQISASQERDLAEVFGGNTLPEGADPVAQLYAGHQFGSFNPQLGDGRALLLGEVVGRDGLRRDIQLKGCGPTPYSRNGDGRAWLGPVLREYVISEAMAALGIPTTRALAAVATGETVWRETGLPGAVLTRVAQSHLRVGTFQVFASRGQTEALRTLTDYAISRHYPHAKGAMGLLRGVRDAQVELIAAWMSVGFIHGVMNTDNSSISGETIDYGPCAFMDVYHPSRVFSSIDRMGRYAYSNQPEIAVWNLAQLATALIQQFDDPAEGVDEATEIVHAMPDLLQAAWLRQFRAKIGLATEDDGDQELITDLLELMAAGQADFTNMFVALAEGTGAEQGLEPSKFQLWERRWQARLKREVDPIGVMQAVNPVIIPRNHRMEQMISAAVAGDYGPFNRQLSALRDPYQRHTEFDDLRHPPSSNEVVKATYCGT